MSKWREHISEDPTKCWCGERPVVEVAGLIVGIAIPLETGDYAIQFFHNEIGRNAEIQVKTFGEPARFTTIDGDQVMFAGRPQS